MIYDDEYQKRISGARTDLKNKLEQLGFTWDEATRKPILNDTGAAHNLRTQYGFDLSGNYDPSNPFSQATLLRQAYQNRLKYNTNSMAAQGQLYSGALQARQGQAHDTFNRGEHDLRTAYNNALQNLFNQAYAAIGDYTNTENQALWDLTLAKAGDPAAAPAPEAASAPAETPAAGRFVNGALVVDGPKPGQSAMDWLREFAAARGIRLSDIKWTSKGLYYKGKSGKWIPIRSA